MKVLEDIDIDLTVQSNILNELEVNNLEPIRPELKVDDSTTVENKSSSLFQWNISNGATVQSSLATNSLFNTNFNPKYAEKAWQSNFNYILGPCNPAFTDATLSYRDIANDLHLEPNPNGVLWRVNAAGIPTYQDLNNYLEQNRVVEAANNRTVEEIKPSLDNASQVIETLKGTETNPTQPKSLTLAREQLERINNPYAEILLANGLPLNTKVSKTSSSSSNGEWTLVFSSEGNYGNVTLYDENNNEIFSCRLHPVE